MLKSVEDYHASYMSIHWWPREELKENRETIDRINRRIGYRLQLRSITWPASITAEPAVYGRDLVGQCGVAPCYCGGFWALTLKDQKDGIAAVLVDEGFDVRNLKVGAPDQGPRRKAPLAIYRSLSTRRAAGHALAAHEGRTLQPVRIGGRR